MLDQRSVLRVLPALLALLVTLFMPACSEEEGPSARTPDAGAPPGTPDAAPGIPDAALPATGDTFACGSGDGAVTCTVDTQLCLQVTKVQAGSATTTQHCEALPAGCSECGCLGGTRSVAACHPRNAVVTQLSCTDDSSGITESCAIQSP